MNMEIKIDKLNIQIEGITLSGENMEDAISNLQLDKLTIRKFLEVPEIDCTCLNTDNILANGAYILAKSKNQYILVPPEQFSSDYEPMGVAVIEGNKSLLVALDGFDDTQLIDNDKKELDQPFYDSREYAYHDFNGKGNTEEILLKKGSPAAKLCAKYHKGKLIDWWLPSFGESDLMYRNKTAINKCLKACGGDMLPDEWHWTSTPFSSRSAWVFSWLSGYTNYYYKDYNYRVRPVSAFPNLSL